jgi:hypothetical protein
MKRQKNTLQTRKCSRKNPVLSKSKPNRISANRQTKGTTQKSGTATTELVNLK